MKIIYYCYTCKKVVQPYHGDPKIITCQNCGDPIKGIEESVVLELAIHIKIRETYGKT